MLVSPLRTPMFLATIVAATVISCGEIEPPSSVASADQDAADREDAAVDAATAIVADASAEAEVADATIDARADASSGRCSGATYAVAPSGAACDPTRIVQNGSFSHPPCYGPPLGSACDWLEMDLIATQTPPAGFVCVPSELGRRACTWVFDAYVEWYLKTDRPFHWSYRPKSWRMDGRTSGGRN